MDTSKTSVNETRMTSTIVTIVLIAALAGVWWYIKSDSEDIQTERVQVGKEFFALKDEIYRIRIDRSIVNHSLLGKLTGVTVILNEQPVGRDNPFAPLPGNTTAPTTRTRR